MSDTGLSPGDATAQLRAKDKRIIQLEAELDWWHDRDPSGWGFYKRLGGGRETDTSGEASPTRVAYPPPSGYYWAHDAAREDGPQIVYVTDRGVVHLWDSEEYRFEDWVLLCPIPDRVVDIRALEAELAVKNDREHCHYDDCWLHGKNPAAVRAEKTEAHLKLHCHEEDASECYYSWAK